MILQKYLNKIGVKSYLDLNQEERETYKRYEQALAGRRITDEEVAQFFTEEKERVTEKLIDPTVPRDVETFYKAELSFLRKIEGMLNAPAMEKKVLEQQLERQIETM